MKSKVAPTVQTKLGFGLTTCMINRALVKSSRRSFKILGSFSRWIHSYQQRSHTQPVETSQLGSWTLRSSSPEKVSRSYNFLHQSMKNLIDRERLRENRNRIAEKNKAEPNLKTQRPLLPRETDEETPAGGNLRAVADLRNGGKVTKFVTSSKRATVIRGKSISLNTSRMISLAPSHPKELRHVHHQGETGMIRGRRCPKKKWQRPHVFIMRKGNADEVTSVFINMRTKLLPPPKTPRGRTRQHQRKRARNPMLLHVWLRSLPASLESSRG